MHFLSFAWFAWLLGTVAGYWILPRGLRDWGLIAATLAFLLVHAPESAALLALFAAVSYVLSRPGPRLGLRISAAAVVVVGVLAYFKIAAAGARTDAPEEAIIPLGLSYFSFRCLAYLIERYRGVLPPHGPFAFAAYLFFLPTIVVGPIHRARPFFDDLARKRWDANDLSAGLERILYGYVKIAVLGNFLVMGKLGDVISGLPPSYDGTILYLRVVRDGLNLYFQFSGFSDVAIGFARLLGYRVIENFNWPYLQRNLVEFWRNWHISLTSWCRQDVYMPTLALTRNPYVAILAMFVVIGFWHDLSIGQLAWALYHAAGVLIFLQWQRLRRRWRLRPWRHPFAAGAARALSTLLTVHYFWFSGVLLRQPSLRAAGDVYRRMFFGWW